MPKTGGGTYWSPDKPDARDYTKEGDENERIKKALLADIVRRLHKTDLMVSDKNEDELVDIVLKHSITKGSPIKDALLMDIMEFGRIIHAEMSAISDAARLGKTLKDATLYCTTFPCHMCAKHVVASGIDRVVFIEPYPKSYAERLHSDSIVVGSYKEKEGRVQFTPFIGISPYRFKELFGRGRRKNDEGTFQDWIRGTPQLMNDLNVANYIISETSIISIMKHKLGEPEVARMMRAKSTKIVEK